MMMMVMITMMMVTIPEFFVTSLPVPLVVGTAMKGKGWFSRGSANDKSNSRVGDSSNGSVSDDSNDDSDCDDDDSDADSDVDSHDASDKR